MVRVFTVRFPVRSPRSGGTLQAPLCPPPRPVPGSCDAHQGNDKGERSECEKQRRMTKESAPRACQAVPADAMKSGVGRNSGVPSPSGFSAPASCSSSHSRTSCSDTALTASSSSSAGTRLPTSVVKRKPSTARPHLSSAKRSRTFHRSFHLSVSFFTSAQRTFCCGFHSGHTLKRCSRVCVGYRHHQHCGEGRFFVQWRYCPVRQCPVLSW